MSKNLKGLTPIEQDNRVQEVKAQDKHDSKKDKKPKRESKGFVRGIKGVWSELKKVEWPRFPVVVKSTGTVLAVVAVFLVVLLAFDLLLTTLVYNPLLFGEFGLINSAFQSVAAPIKSVMQYFSSAGRLL